MSLHYIYRFIYRVKMAFNSRNYVHGQLIKYVLDYIYCYFIYIEHMLCAMCTVTFTTSLIQQQHRFI
jgi:hypothetical protein